MSRGLFAGASASPAPANGRATEQACGGLYARAPTAGGPAVHFPETVTRPDTALDTVESFGVGYGQPTNTGGWMKPPGDLFLYCDMKDLAADMVQTHSPSLFFYHVT